MLDVTILGGESVNEFLASLLETRRLPGSDEGRARCVLQVLTQNGIGNVDAYYFDRARGFHGNVARRRREEGALVLGINGQVIVRVGRGQVQLTSVSKRIGSVKNKTPFLFRYIVCQ